MSIEATHTQIGDSVEQHRVKPVERGSEVEAIRLYRGDNDPRRLTVGEEIMRVVRRSILLLREIERDGIDLEIIMPRVMFGIGMGMLGHVIHAKIPEKVLKPLLLGLKKKRIHTEKFQRN